MHITPGSSVVCFDYLVTALVAK